MKKLLFALLALSIIVSCDDNTPAPTPNPPAPIVASGSFDVDSVHYDIDTTENWVTILNNELNLAFSQDSTAGVYFVIVNPALGEFELKMGASANESWAQWKSDATSDCNTTDNPTAANGKITITKFSGGRISGTFYFDGCTLNKTVKVRNGTFTDLKIE